MKNIFLTTFTFIIFSACSNIAIDDLTKVSKDVKAKGYVVLEERKAAFCEENCPLYSYAFFVFDKNIELQHFIEQNEGNAFVKKNAIGIGCVNEEGVYYHNNSDIGIKDEVLPLDTSNKILQSNTKNKIDLSFRREIVSAGKGAPNCYSHFRDFEIYNTHR